MCRANRTTACWALALISGLALLILGGCATTERLPPVPLALASAAGPIEIPDARFYPDTDGSKLEALGARAFERQMRHLGAKARSQRLPPAHFIAISGGGDDGAFGAGLLVGWSERGDRPSFRLVTGVSTGALSAPFVFLGPSYDEALKKVYTQTEASDVFEKRGPVVAALAADAMTDTAPLREMIARFVDQKMIHAIAEEYGKGRLLMVMTTNLDQGRAVIWNIGAIAESRHSRSRELIVDILLASASIPAVFPPVMIDVSHEGKHYQEMHVDGGATAQAFLYPAAYKLKQASLQAGVARQRHAYLIRNGRLHRPEAEVKRQTLSVATQATATMIASSGVNDAYRIYLTTKRDGVDFNLAYIDDAFADPYVGPFDRSYMTKLFQYGYQKGKEGYHWHKVPPGYSE